VIAVGAARGAQGVPLRPGLTVFDLGSGRRAERTATSLYRRGIRLHWTVNGFAPPSGTAVLAYAATPTGRLIALHNDAVDYSDDGGHTWQHASVFEPIYHAVALSMADGQHGALVTTDHGIWTTRDGGASWWQAREHAENLLDDVIMAGSLAVFSDVRGGVRALDTATGTIQTLCEADVSAQTSAELRRRGDSVRAVAGRCRWSIGPTGATQERP
jgi:hypothetical protein